MKHQLSRALQLCLLVDSKQHPEFILKAIRGGVTMVQLREKNMDSFEIEKHAITLLRLLAPFNIPLIINDDARLAAKINAAGVHLGQKDMQPVDAYNILGPNKIIGLSIESLPELEIANNIKFLSYVTASAVFLSKSKPDCKTIWGINGLKEIVSLSKHPVTGIGGINKENAATLINSGAKGIAVIGAILDAPDPLKAALDLRKAMSRSIAL